MATCTALFLLAFYVPVLECNTCKAHFLCFCCCLPRRLFTYCFLQKRSLLPKELPTTGLVMAMKIKLSLVVKNEFPFPVHIEVIDELPVQLQIRNWKKKLNFKAAAAGKNPLVFKTAGKREYHFGNIHLFVSTPLVLFQQKVFHRC